MRTVMVMMLLLGSADGVPVQLPGNAPVKHSLAAIRTVASAVEAFAAAQHRYPAADTWEGLVRQLQPRYLVMDKPLIDGWGTELLYVASADGCRYRIVSAGADREFSESYASLNTVTVGRQITAEAGADIVYEDNAFRALPAGFEKAFALHEDRQFRCAGKRE